MIQLVPEERISLPGGGLERNRLARVARTDIKTAHTKKGFPLAFSSVERYRSYRDNHYRLLVSSEVRSAAYAARMHSNYLGFSTLLS